MAVFKLSERTWWGDMSAPVAMRGQYRSLLDLAGNYTSDQVHWRYSQIDPDVLIFRIPVLEDAPVNLRVWGALKGVFEAILFGEGYPLLVHCMAGQCRSPIVAVMHEWFLGPCIPETVAAALDRMRELRVDLDEKRAFHASLRERLLANAPPWTTTT